MFSSTLTEVDDMTHDYLLSYFLQNFRPHDFQHFAHSVELNLNAVYTLISKLFAAPDQIVSLSQDLGKLLYESSDHPRIKAGKLNVAYLHRVELDGEIMDAVGLFKSESEEPFIKIVGHDDGAGDGQFYISHDIGFDIKAIDKACVVFNTEKKDGYRVLVIDKGSAQQDAQFWKDEFLRLAPITNEYHQTGEVLGRAQQFVKEVLPAEIEVEQADRMDMLNKSVNYFKEHEVFNQQEFEQEVFTDTAVRESFRKFDEIRAMKSEVEVVDEFEISKPAVRKQEKFFKSVLKLDKNFHVYIHGDRSKIERGEEEDGRRFYKLYYEQESE